MGKLIPISARSDRKSDWAGFVCFSLWTAFNVALAVGVFRRAPIAAIFFLPTFAHEALIALSFLMRKPLLKQAEGWAPRLAAYVATFMTPAFFFFSSRWKPEWVHPSPPALFVGGVFLWLVGAYVGLWSLLSLRRAFSIVPQARTLVTRGPYRLARHPVYASYLLQYGGVALSHLSFPLATVFFAWLGIVMLRISHEEKVLAATFPEYAEYRRRVGTFAPRFIAAREPAIAVPDPPRYGPVTEVSKAKAGARP